MIYALWIVVLTCVVLGLFVFCWAVNEKLIDRRAKKFFDTYDRWKDHR